MVNSLIRKIHISPEFTISSAAHLETTETPNPLATIVLIAVMLPISMIILRFSISKSESKSACSKTKRLPDPASRIMKGSSFNSKSEIVSSLAHLWLLETINTNSSSKKS